MSIIDDIMGNPIAPGPSPLTPPFPPMQSAQNPPLPGVGTGGTPPFVGNPAQDQAQGMNQAVAQMIMQRQMAGQGGGQAPMPGTPGRVGAMLPGAPLPFMGQGPQIPGTPNATALAQMGPRGQIPQQNVNSPVEFRTKAGRNAQIVKDAINNFGTAVNQIKQEQWNKKASQTSQAWSEQVDAQQVLATSQDPQARKLAQAKLDAMQKDPKLQKAFAKAHEDPTSAEGVGVQRAMQMRQAQAAQQVEMEAKQAQIQKALADAQEARARAAYQTSPVGMGTEVSADVKAQQEVVRQNRIDMIEQRRREMEINEAVKRDQLAEKTTNDADKLRLMKEIGEGRLENQRMLLDIRREQMEAKSKLPPALITRVTQGQLIQEQIDKLKTMAQDPDVAKYMGPAKGPTVGWASRVAGNQKLQDFYFTAQSLDAMLPILHGYRGGAQTHQMFTNMSGNMNVDSKAYIGTLNSLDGLTKNLLTDMKAAYPKDPIWGIESASGAGSTSTVPADVPADVKAMIDKLNQGK